MFTTKKDKIRTESNEVGHPVSSSQFNICESSFPWRGGEKSAMGDNCEEWGVGGLVPGNDYIIHEQSQSLKVVEQVVNGTRVPFVGVTPGSDDATGGKGGVRESESGRNLKRQTAIYILFISDQH